MSRYIRKLELMLSFADSIRQLSTDPTAKFGAVVFPHDCSTIAFGYNGAPAGFPHERMVAGHNSSEGSGMAHAEVNALLKTTSIKPQILFVHNTPCSRCAAYIINSRIIDVVIHEDPYEGDSGLGLEMLRMSTIKTVHRSNINDSTWQQLVSG